MLAKLNRLTKNKEFERVFKKGRSSFDTILGIKAAANDLGYPRYGILVGSKVSKQAVIRNKIRRRIREGIRKIAVEMDKGYDYVIISLPAVKGKSYLEILASLENNLRRLKPRKRL